MDLFDFDVAVAPLLEVLVAKTLEQALLEVRQERELRDIAHALVRTTERGGEGRRIDADGVLGCLCNGCAGGVCAG